MTWALTVPRYYLLSYVGKVRQAGVEPALSAWKADVLPKHFNRMAFPGLALERVVLSELLDLEFQGLVGEDVLT